MTDEERAPAPGAGAADAAGACDPADVLAPRGGGLPVGRRGLLVTAVGLVLAVLGCHLALTFLHLSPRSEVADRYQEQVRWWIQPWFDQDWTVFATEPGPVTATNIRLEGRTSDGGAAGPWLDLTEVDYAAIRYHPAPSRLHQNSLRISWNHYRSRPDSPRARQYLENVVTGRLAELGERDFTSFQLRVTYQEIPAPGLPVPPPSSTVHDWWEVGR